MGRVPGHVLVIGTDYFEAMSNNAPAATLLQNAVFGATRKTRPTRILTYVEHATVTSVTHVKNIVTTEPKPVWADALDSETVLTELSAAKYDAFVIFDQPSAASGKLKTLGETWQNALASYSGAGGRVVILDGGSGTGEMKDFLTFSGLLPVTSETTLGRVQLQVAVPTDELAAGVSSVFAARPNTVSFSLQGPPAPSDVVVVKDPNGAPVVIHLAR